MEEQSQNKKTYDEKKEAKIQARQSQQNIKSKKTRIQSIVRTLVVLLILGGLIFLFVRAVQKELPQGGEAGVFFESQGRDHVNIGDEHEVYNSNPPSSGSHLSSPASVGFYEEPLPDERVIHNMEHGDIWIAYHPRLKDNEDVMDMIKSFEVDGKVIITPREENDTDMALVAWEWLDKFDITENSLPEERVKDFIKRHRNRGPEKVSTQSHVRN